MSSVCIPLLKMIIHQYPQQLCLQPEGCLQCWKTTHPGSWWSREALRSRHRPRHSVMQLDRARSLTILGRFISLHVNPRSISRPCLSVPWRLVNAITWTTIHAGTSSSPEINFTTSLASSSPCQRSWGWDTNQGYGRTDLGVGDWNISSAPSYLPSTPVDEARSRIKKRKEMTRLLV